MCVAARQNTKRAGIYGHLWISKMTSVARVHGCTEAHVFVNLLTKDPFSMQAPLRHTPLPINLTAFEHAGSNPCY